MLVAYLDQEDTAASTRTRRPVVGKGRARYGETSRVRKHRRPRRTAVVSKLGVFDGDAGAGRRGDRTGPSFVGVAQEEHGTERDIRIRSHDDRSFRRIQFAPSESDI